MQQRSRLAVWALCLCFAVCGALVVAEDAEHPDAVTEGLVARPYKPHYAPSKDAKHSYFHIHHEEYPPHNDQHYPEHEEYHHNRDEEYHHERPDYYRKHSYGNDHNGSDGYGRSGYGCNQTQPGLCRADTCTPSGEVCRPNTCTPATGECATGITCPIGPSALTRVIPVSEESLTATFYKGKINFSEDQEQVGAINPRYEPAYYETPQDYAESAPKVDFGAFLIGQSLSACPGAGEDGGPPAGTLCLLKGTPEYPVAINETFYTIEEGGETIKVYEPPYVRIGDPVDAAFPPAIVGAQLAEDPVEGPLLTYGWSPISMVFSTPVVSFGVVLATLDAPNTVEVTAYNEAGDVIYTTKTTERDALEEEHPPAERDGKQFVGFATNDGSADIKAVTIALVANDTLGFYADDVIFTYTCCDPGVRRQRVSRRRQRTAVTPKHT